MARQPACPARIVRGQGADETRRRPRARSTGARTRSGCPSTTSKGAFAYSVGLYYLYNLPEILLVSPSPAAIGVTSQRAGADGERHRRRDGRGTRIKPGDRYALVAETVARTVDSACTLDHASLGESRFVLPSRRLEERTLGAASWFYANFMDVLDVPGARVPAAAVARCRRLRRCAAPPPARRPGRRSRCGGGRRRRRSRVRGGAGRRRRGRRRRSARQRKPKARGADERKRKKRGKGKR